MPHCPLPLYYSALDFGIADYTPVQNVTRTENDARQKAAQWMVPLYSERDRLTKVVGYITWNSVARTTDDGDLAVSELIILTTGKKGMMAINAYTNSNGYYQVGEKYRFQLTQGSLSYESKRPFDVSRKNYAQIEKDPKGNWRTVRLSPLLERMDG